MRSFLGIFPVASLIVVAASCGSSSDGTSDFSSQEVTNSGNDPAGEAGTINDPFACDGSCTTPAPDASAKPSVCGDGILSGTEACDDHNTKDGDGCNSTCSAVDVGWRCPTPGLRCEALMCGDGVVAGNEECDYPPGAPVAGCDASTCKIQTGFDCDPVTHACKATQCGNGLVERGESCEDGNTLPFDGCYNCQTEPSCTNGVCKAVCGDGQRFATEECDDGNLRDGDGCSADCKTETGYACTDVSAQPPQTIDLPVLVRDFIGKGNQLGTATYHEDFNQHGGNGVLGIVLDDLGSDGRPVYNCPGGDCAKNPGHLYLDGNNRPNTSTKANFDQWYRDTPNVNLTSVFTLSLQRNSGQYQWDSGDSTMNSGKTYFDPVGTGGWIAAGSEQRVCDPLRNVSFSSETHFWFEYQGGERFDFAGDDDTWIFLNGKLAVDLGGLHVPKSGYFSLDADTDMTGPDTADGTGLVFGDVANATKTIDFGMVAGGVYEVVMFQAERNQCGSNFKVTLEDFNRPKSTCASTCGDGIVASDEVCDDGKNDGSYGGCMPGCQAHSAICGDGKVDPGEECDDGNQNNGDACTNACTKQNVK